MPGPVIAKPPFTLEQQAEKAKKQNIAAAQLYNPFEAKKRPTKAGEYPMSACIWTW
jgi:hypothetical protein